MATTVETYAAQTNEQRNFYDMVLLEFAKANLPHAAFGQMARNIQIPLNNGVTVEFRRYSALSAATTALTEGITPAGSNITISKVTATVSEYGDFVRYADKFKKTAIDDVVTGISKLLGYQCGLTIDTLSRDEMVANCTAQYASTATATAEVSSTMYLTANEILEALATIEGNDGRPFSNAHYPFIIHPKAKYDLLQDSTVMNSFLHATDPGKENPVYTHKWGEWMGLDFYVTSNAYVNSAAGLNSQNVYTSLIIAEDAYGCGGLAGDIASGFGATQQDPLTGQDINPVSMKMVEAGTPSPSDPLGQRGSIGWITTFVPKVLNADWIVGIEHSSRLS